MCIYSGIYVHYICRWIDSLGVTCQFGLSDSLYKYAYISSVCQLFCSTHVYTVALVVHLMGMAAVACILYFELG